MAERPMTYIQLLDYVRENIPEEGMEGVLQGELNPALIDFLTNVKTDIENIQGSGAPTYEEINSLSEIRAFLEGITNDKKLINLLQISSGEVTTSKIEDGAVTTPKIANNAVTTEKVNNAAITGAKIADGAVTSAKIANGAVTMAKIGNDVVENGIVESSTKLLTSGSAYPLQQTIGEIGGIVNGQDVIEVHSSKNSRIAIWLNWVCDVPQFTIKVDAPESEHRPAHYSVYLYKTPAPSTTEYQLYHDCNFGEDVVITPNEGYKYIYLFHGVTEETLEEPITYTTTIKTGSGLSGRIETIEKTSLYGKRIVCFGDSLTEYKDEHDKRYTDYLQENTGAIITNVGIGGTQLRQRSTPVLEPESEVDAYAALDIVNMVKIACEDSSALALARAAATYIKSQHSWLDYTGTVERLAAVNFSEIDAITIFGGTNDWNNGAYNRGTHGSTDINTTMGAINTIIDLLSTKYPHIKLYWFLPTVRFMPETYGGSDFDFNDPDLFSDNYIRPQDATGITLKEFAALVYDEVIDHHIPICDLYNCLGWNMKNFGNYFPTTDGTHPTKAGMKAIGDAFTQFLRNANLSSNQIEVASARVRGGVKVSRNGLQVSADETLKLSLGQLSGLIIDEDGGLALKLGGSLEVLPNNSLIVQIDNETITRDDDTDALKIKDSGVDTDQLADDAVTLDKIAESSFTRLVPFDNDKIVSGGILRKYAAHQTAIAPEWETNHLYYPGMVRMYEGVRYVAILEHRSGAEFDTDYWEVENAETAYRPMTDEEVDALFV